jgi:hypothetical protein
MEKWLGLGIPGAVLLLIAIGTWELRPKRQKKRAGTPLSATYVNELTALFYGTKRVELDHRDSISMMRDEDPQAAPPNQDIDLDKGTVTLRPDPRHSPVTGQRD